MGTSTLNLIASSNQTALVARFQVKLGMLFAVTRLAMMQIARLASV
jgi:hypothetical protein